MAAEGALPTVFMLDEPAWCAPQGVLFSVLVGCDKAKRIATIGSGSGLNAVRRLANTETAVLGLHRSEPFVLSLIMAQRCPSSGTLRRGGYHG